MIITLYVITYLQLQIFRMINSLLHPSTQMGKLQHKICILPTFKNLLGVHQCKKALASVRLTQLKRKSSEESLFICLLTNHLYKVGVEVGIHGTDHMIRLK